MSDPIEEIRRINQRLEVDLSQRGWADKQSQLLIQGACVAEEGGEFLKEVRRFTNAARTRVRQETARDAVLMELGDVLLSAAVACDRMGTTYLAVLDKAIERINKRGGI